MHAAMPAGRNVYLYKGIQARKLESFDKKVYYKGLNKAANF